MFWGNAGRRVWAKSPTVERWYVHKQESKFITIGGWRKSIKGPQIYGFGNCMKDGSSGDDNTLAGQICRKEGRGQFSFSEMCGLSVCKPADKSSQKRRKTVATEVL